MLIKIPNLITLVIIVPSLISCIQVNLNNEHIDRIIDNVEELTHYHPNLADSILNEVQEKYHQKYLANYYPRLIYLDGLLYYKQGFIDSSLIKIELSINEAINISDIETQAKCQLLLGWISEGLGQWEQAKINYYNCLDIFQNSNNLNVGLASFGLARCKYYLKDEYQTDLENGTNLISKYGSKEHVLQSNYISTLLKKDFNKSDFRTLNKLAEEFISIGLENNAANIYKNLAIKYQSANEMDSAIICINKGLNCNFSNSPEISELPALLQIKGALLYMNKSYHEALQFSHEALEYYSQFNLEARKYYAYHYIHKSEYALGNLYNAYHYSNKALKVYKKNKTISKSRLAKVMEISSQIKKLESENNNLRFEHKISILSSVLALTVLLTISYAFLKRYQTNQNKIKIKNSELQKLMDGMNEKILMQRKLGKEYEVNKNKKIKTLADQFDECYYETISKVLTTYPSLTKVEARYGLMFSLGLSNDVISSILSVQKSTIRKAKHRLKEKLELDESEELNEYFKKHIVTPKRSLKSITK